jgi:hypothetical protein
VEIDLKRLLMLVLAALALPAAAFATITSGDGTTIANGQATLVSNGTPGQEDSWVSFDDLNGQSPTALTSLSAKIASATGWGGGSPRFQVRVTNGTETHNIFVYLGVAPGFTDGATGDTGNLLAAGAGARVDWSQLAPSSYGTWGDALAAAAAGGYNEITGISLVVDGSWVPSFGGSQQVVFNSVSINGTPQNFAPSTPAPTCTTVHTSLGDFTAAIKDPGANFAGPLPVSGCQIGVYFDQYGSVNNADIAGATHYGVFADKGAVVNVTGSHIHQIGNTPFDGMQNGRAVFFTNGANGTVSNSLIDNYQKNGVVATGDKTSVSVLNNTITGRGQLGDIAQNGVVFISGATGLIKGNTISGNWYTPKSYVGCGVLFLDASGVKQQANSFSANEQDLCNFGRGGGNASV